MSEEQFKLVIYIPADSFVEILDALCGEEINRIGNYVNCMSWRLVFSTWTPVTGAHPTKGVIGERSIEPEIRLELSCKKQDIEEVVQKIRELHPYEEPEIDLYPIVIL